MLPTLDAARDTAAPANQWLPVHRFTALREYQAFLQRVGAAAHEEEAAVVRRYPSGDFPVPGTCWVCRVGVDFRGDYKYVADPAPGCHPNWRERLECPRCGLINRQRAMMQLAGETLALSPKSRIYLTEQHSALHREMLVRFPRTVGSEFLGPECLPGTVAPNGIRHEDMTSLSFTDRSLDAVLTFDVLEHVPAYRRALRECFRVLAPGGVLLLSAPFLADSNATRLRAEVAADGSVVHHHPPQFHGDPVNPEGGILCFQEFGWDLLEVLAEAGFADACVLAYRSAAFGYLGGWQLVFTARRPGARPWSLGSIRLKFGL